MGRWARGPRQLWLRARGGQEDSVLPLGARIVLALALLGVLGAIILTAQAGDFLQGIPVRIQEPPRPVVRISYEKDMVITSEALILKLWGRPSISPQDNKRYYVFRIPVGTGSMYPLLGGGELILVEEVKATALQVNDVIVWRTVSVPEGRTHRLVAWGVDKDGWWGETKGDNNWERDGVRLREGDILGLLRAVFYN